MERFGWTYDEYLEQPGWLIDVFRLMIVTSKKVERKQQLRREQMGGS